MRLTLKDAQDRYGIIDPVHKTWSTQNQWMTLLVLPEDLVCENWLVGGTITPVRRIYCNKDMVNPLLAALCNVKERGLQSELKTFDGCFNIRMVRGSIDQPSTHSYGLAIDLNAKENPLGGPCEFSDEFVKCFMDVGFAWGGHFHRLDGMHFSYAYE